MNANNFMEGLGKFQKVSYKFLRGRERERESVHSRLRMRVYICARARVCMRAPECLSAAALLSGIKYRSLKFCQSSLDD